MKTRPVGFFPEIGPEMRYTRPHSERRRRVGRTADPPPQQNVTILAEQHEMLLARNDSHGNDNGSAQRAGYGTGQLGMGEGVMQARREAEPAPRGEDLGNLQPKRCNRSDRTGSQEMGKTRDAREQAVHLGMGSDATGQPARGQRDAPPKAQAKTFCGLERLTMVVAESPVCWRLSQDLSPVERSHWRD